MRRYRFPVRKTHPARNVPEYTFFAERTQEKAWICRISCHRRYDMTAEEIKKKIQNISCATYGRFDIVLTTEKERDALGMRMENSTWI